MGRHIIIWADIASSLFFLLFSMYFIYDILIEYFGVPWVSGTIHTETKPYPIYIEIEYNIRLHDVFNETKPSNH